MLSNSLCYVVQHRQQYRTAWIYGYVQSVLFKPSVIGSLRNPLKEVQNQVQPHLNEDQKHKLIHLIKCQGIKYPGSSMICLSGLLTNGEV